MIIACGSWIQVCIPAGIPSEAVNKIQQLERDHGISLQGFKMAAPAKAFRLLNYDDPLLFAPLTNNKFYLIHQWGNDLSLKRKWLSWPWRNLFTFIVFSLALSILITWITPETKLSHSVPMASAIIFLFAFKSIFAVGLYSFYMLGKQFSSSSWDSLYFNN